MKWFSSTIRKATRQLFSTPCRRNHIPTSTKSSFSGHSSSMTFGYQPYTQRSTGCSFFARDQHNTSTLCYTNSPSKVAEERRLTSTRDDEVLDLEIISAEIIKPASPTPDHLRTFHLSLLDQYFFKHHTPIVLFFPNSDNISISDVINLRSKKLKQSLSEVLTRFYPFAGEIKDDFHIECNDKGVCYVEVRVKQTLSGFLTQPDDQKVTQLIPKHPEESSQNHPLSVQVNIFDCGGIALTTCLTHKIVDGHTAYLFLSAWSSAVAVGGLSEKKISPSFIAASVFPSNPSLVGSLPFKIMDRQELSTRRFVFDSTALTSLKAKASPLTWPTAGGPTRVEAAGGALWNAATRAASAVRAFTPNSPHVLVTLVNIRKRMSPPLPVESIGNLIMPAVAMCFPDTKPNLPSLMRLMRGSIKKVNPEYISKMSGEKGYLAVDRLLNDFPSNTGEDDVLHLTSVGNSGLNQIDFGWGKPVWVYVVNAGIRGLVVLNDTMKGGGVEATVSLSPETMAIFEQDPKLRSYACVDPSPLQFCHRLTMSL